MSYELIAGVDLGSNSFRLQIGRVVGDQIHPLDTLKETVRLGSGLTREKLLDHASQQRAIEALAPFRRAAARFSPDAVRAVTTDAMRVAKNAPTWSCRRPRRRWVFRSRSSAVARKRV
jgi:exopolyphosphatase/guanosine-5'-triphosphate,3'-diphosphate pyrophosphatase